MTSSYSEQSLYNLYVKAFGCAEFDSPRVKVHLARRTLGYHQESLGYIVILFSCFMSNSQNFNIIVLIPVRLVNWAGSEARCTMMLTAHLFQKRCVFLQVHRHPQSLDSWFSKLFLVATDTRSMSSTILFGDMYMYLTHFSGSCAQWPKILLLVSRVGKISVEQRNIGRWWYLCGHFCFRCVIEMYLCTFVPILICSCQSGAAIFKICPNSPIFKQLPALANQDVQNWMATTYQSELCALQAQQGSTINIQRMQDQLLQTALEEVCVLQAKHINEIGGLIQLMKRRTAVFSPMKGFSTESYHRSELFRAIFY